MDGSTDPTFASTHAATGLSSLVKAGVVWAGNPVVTDMKSNTDKLVRYHANNAPLALYRGTEDSEFDVRGRGFRSVATALPTGPPTANRPANCQPHNQRSS